MVEISQKNLIFSKNPPLPVVAFGAKTKVELHEDSGESPRPESKLGDAP